MKNKITLMAKRLSCLLAVLLFTASVKASSHREAPFIANDPLADNTDLYAFRSPDNPNMITIIANYVPGQLPHGGPNYYGFGTDVRYEIHIDNNLSTMRYEGKKRDDKDNKKEGGDKNGDDIVYR